MQILKGILKEQLDNAIRLKKDYINAMSKLWHGNIINKRIHSHDYYYNEYRSGNKVIFKYLGKPDQEELKKYKEDKHRYQEYKKMVGELDKQIGFLRKALKYKDMANV